MAKKKAAEKQIPLSAKEAEMIAQIAHAAQREADLIDQTLNQADDFQVQTWEFLIPRQKRSAVGLVESMAGKPDAETKYYKAGKVFDVVAKALI